MAGPRTPRYGWMTIRRIIFGTAGLTAVVVATWMVVTIPGSSDMLAGAGVLVAIATFALESWRRTSPTPSHSIDGYAASLADVVLAEWQVETTARLVNTEGLLRLSWAPAELGIGQGADEIVGALTGSTQLRLRHLSGETKGGLDDAAASLASEFTTAGVRRLLLLGQPGAGKTVLAMLLSLGLLRCRQPSMPVPVLLSVSSWDAPTEMLRTWLIRTVADLYYGGRRDIPEKLMEQRRILPLLDGLDEIPEASRRDAIRGINEILPALPGIVVTCRSTEYADVIADGSPLLHRAPVVQVLPLAPREVAAYLRSMSWPDGSDMQLVLRHLTDQPHSDLTAALSTPLMVSVLATVYRNRCGGDPAELLRFGSRHAIEDHLLDRLIDVAYPEKTRAAARRRLTFLADCLHRDRERDFAWWALSRRVLGTWVAPVVALAGGLALFAVTAAFELLSGADELDPSESVRAATYVGVFFAIGTIIVWYATSGSNPGRLQISREGSLAQLRTGFLIGFAIVGIPAVPIMIVFAIITTVTDGWTFESTPSFFSSVAVSGAIAVTLGMALAVHRWLHGDAGQAVRVDPLTILRQDRRSSLVGAAVAGLVVALISMPAWVIGAEVGDMIGEALTGWPGTPGSADLAVRFANIRHDLGYPLKHPGAILAAWYGPVLPGFMFFLFVLITRAWTRFSVARVALALKGQMPLRLMRFLDDAHRRQVLRQAGGRYQFRHIRLQEHLVSKEARARVEAHESLATTSTQQMRRLRLASAVVVAGAVIVAATTLPSALPQDGAYITLVDRPGMILAVAFSPDDRFLASGGEHGAVTLWDVHSGVVVARLTPGHGDDEDVELLRFAPDGRTLVSGSAKQTVLWDIPNQRRITHVLGSVANQLTPGPTGRTFVMSQVLHERGAHLFDTHTGMEIGPSTLRRQAADAVAYSSDEKRVALTSGVEHSVYVLDAQTGALEQNLRVPEDGFSDGGWSSGVTAVTWSSDGNTLIAASGSRVWAWNANTGKLLRTLGTPGKDVSKLAYGPVGDVAAVGDTGGTTLLWNIKTGKKIATLRCGTKPIDQVAFSPDGQTLITRIQVDDHPLELWSTVDGRPVHRLMLEDDDSPGPDVLFDHKSRFVVAFAYNQPAARVWEVATGQVWADLKGHTGSIRDAQFSNDGNFLATASQDGSVRIWNLAH